MDGLKDYHQRLLTVSVVPIDCGSSSESTTDMEPIDAACDPPDRDCMESEEEIVGCDPEIQPLDLEEDSSDHEDEASIDQDEAAIDEDESWKEAVAFALTFHNESRYAPILFVGAVNRRLGTPYVMVFSDDEWEVCKVLGQVFKDGITSEFYYYMPVHTTTRLEYNFPTSEYGRDAKSNTRWLLLSIV